MTKLLVSFQGKGYYMFMQDSQPQKASFFPKIHRFITEKGTIMVILLASCVVIGGIGFEGMRLYQSYHQKEALAYKKVQLVQELHYWQDVARQFANYRDVHFRIATIQYQLGDTQSARKSLEKVLSIDPNFEEARVFDQTIAAN